MIDMAELVIPTLTIMGPLVVGAFKGYFAIKLMRVLADIVSPTVAALGVMFFLNLLLTHTQVVTESDLTNIWYPASLGVITVFSGLGFYLAVGLGSRLAQRNDAELQNDMKKGLELARDVITPSLEEFLRKTKEGMDGIMKERNGDVLRDIANMKNSITEQRAESGNILKRVRELEQAVYEMSDIQRGIDSIMNQMAKYSETMPDLQEELIDRIESLKALQDDVPDTDEASKTILTYEDGRANRIIGHRQQDDMAQTLRDMELDITVKHGIGEPDYEIKKRGSEAILAIGSNKSYALHDEPKRMQRRVTAKDCRPEIVRAKRRGVPMVLFVTNTVNGRMWMKIVQPDELGDWKGISTPVMLAKDDEDTRIQLEEIFANGIVELGGRA